MNPAYAYIYDDFLSDRRYQDTLAALETRLASLGLAGHVGRLTLFRSVKDLVEHFVGQGAKTIVVVGNDQTLDKVLWFLPDLPVVLGYIPLAAPADIATLLNVPSGLDACQALGARLIETLDVGKLDDRYFLSEAVFERTRACLQVGDEYKLSLVRGGTLAIRNLGAVTKHGAAAADARDGLLEAVMLPAEDADLASRIWRRWTEPPRETRITFRRGVIESDQPMEGHADKFAISGFRFTVSIVPKKLRVITGRGRLFEAGAR